jgi:hypothetical protein
MSVVLLLGLIDIIFAIAAFTATLILLFKNGSSSSGSKIGFYVIQFILVPLCLLLAGAIFVVQGWRLNPILTFAVLCLHVIIAFLLLRDFFINFDRSS